MIVLESGKYFLSIDIGSEYIKLIAFENDKVDKEIKPVKHLIRKVEESELNNHHPERCIINSFKEAYKEIGIENFENTFVNINNDKLISQTFHSREDFDRPVIINESILKNINENILSKISQNEEVIYLRTNKYIIDNKLEVIDPLLMEAKSIEVENFLVKIEKKYLDNIENILSSCNLSATSIIPGSVAQGEILLTSQEKNLGSCLIDIGYSTTDVVCYEGGNIILCWTLNMGIGDFIEALSSLLYLKYKDTYYIFKDNANLLQTESQAPISFIDIYGAKSVITVGFFNKILEDLIKQLFVTLRNIFERNNIKIHAITLSGGLSHLQGIKGLANRVFNLHRVKVGKLNDTKSPELANNKWATCFGMIHIASNDIETPKIDIYNLLYQIKSFIEKLLK